MNDRLLLIDADNLAARCFHALPNETGKDGWPVGAIRGFLKSTLHLMERFPNRDLVFCFDHPTYLRTKAFPDYKKRTPSPNPQKLKADLGHQKKRLRNTTLGLQLGYGNVLHAEGYESDDVIARVCQTWEHSEILICSTDQDLYQLLTPKVSIYDFGRKEVKTYDWFLGEYQIPPSKWALVKAIGGCVSDGIPGVVACGVKRSVEYLKGSMTRSSKIYEAVELQKPAWQSRLALTRLPYEGCPEFARRPDKDSEKNWAQVCRAHYGIEVDRYARLSYGLRTPREEAAP